MSDFDNAWRRWMTDYNEGLGLVYERLILNDFLDDLLLRFGIESVLEVPLYGMAGSSGINSVRFAQQGVHVTLVDVLPERLRAVRTLWQELGLQHQMTLICTPDMTALPFEDAQFDLVWNWAALWHLPDAAATLREMARVANELVFVAMPNPLQPGYLLRRHILEPQFFSWVRDVRWSDIELARHVLEDEGLRLIERGVLDVPPWPDTVMPAREVLNRLGVGELLGSRFEGEQWEWSTMDYYMGRRPELKAQMDRYAFLERLPIPWWLKLPWAHHRYLLLRKPS